MTTRLEHPPSRILAELLYDLGLSAQWGGSNAWSVYCSREPNLPDNVITVYDTSDSLQGTDQVSGEEATHFGIQVRVRANNYLTGYNKADDIVSLLDTVSLADVWIPDDEDFTGTGTVQARYEVQSFDRTSGILPLGVEKPDSFRELFVINGTVPIRLVST